MTGAEYRLCDVALDCSFRTRDARVEREQALAITDLLESNSFTPIGHDGGPYRLKIKIAEGLGDRIRVGGMAEISGYTNDLGPGRRRTREHSVMDLFPGGDAKQASYWSGLRPMTPDGTPVIGPTKIAPFLNTGHGTLGSTMSSGSARVLADLVSARKPEINATDLAISRYV